MNISISEVIVILLIALLVIKPDQLPEVAQGLGRFTRLIREFFTKMKTELSAVVPSDSTGSNLSSREKAPDPVDSKEPKRD